MANNQLKEELILSTQHFDKKIEDVIKRVNRLQHQGNKVGDGFNDSMGKMIQKATGFNGSMTSILGTVTKLGGALGVITSGVQLADWFKSSVAEGNKLAKEGEGIRLAFERLNKGNLLDNLRQETHNTVTDLELMKQAVKFNDFKLNLDELGTFLAFAQQKAKDTGQSIDYMVDSIVTGLGRKSLPILDNLGLSAAQIKEKMKDGGDMTKAVAEIIKEKMKESGDYIETAADRAKKSEVEIQNELEKLGRVYQPLIESSNNLFHTIEVSAIKAAEKVGLLANTFTELGRIQNNYLKLGGSDKVTRMLNNLGNGKSKGQRNIYNNQIKEFDRFIKKYQDKIDSNPYNQAAKEQLAAIKKMKYEYQRQAKYIFDTSTNTNVSNSDTKTTKNNKSKKDIEYAVNSVGYLENKISELNKQIKLQVDYESIKTLQKEIEKTKGQLAELMQPTKKLDVDFSNIKPNFASATAITEELQAFLKREPLDITIKTDKTSLKDTANAIEDIGNALSSIGSNLDLPVIDVLGVIASAIASVIQGYAFATSKAGAELGPFGWIAFAATGLAELTAIIAQIHSLSGYANGGVIGGSSYGGDRLLARVNSGEAIVTQNQQNHLFEMLNNGTYGNGVNGGNVHFVIKGKDLVGCIRNYEDKISKVR